MEEGKLIANLENLTGNKNTILLYGDGVNYRVQPEDVFRRTLEQEAIFEFAELEGSHGFINAAAGSGKTTTVVDTYNRIWRSAPDVTVSFIVFTRAAKYALATKLGGSENVVTCNALGHRAIREHIGVESGYRSLNVIEDKYNALILPFLKRIRVQIKVRKRTTGEGVLFDEEQVVSHLLSLIDTCRLGLVDPHDPTAVKDLAKQYGLIVYPELISVLPSVLEKGAEIAMSRGEIDHNDQLWLPHYWNISFLDQVDVLFIDEAQDISSAALDVAVRSLSSSGRIFAVGDPHQAIYGFAGACHDSMERILKLGEGRTPLNGKRVKILHLNTCFRCPTNVLRYGRAYRSQIHGLKTGGIVRAADVDEMIRDSSPGDLIISRYNASLVSLALLFAEKQKPVFIRGKGFDQHLLNFLSASQSDRNNNEPAESPIKDYIKKTLSDLEKSEIDDYFLSQQKMILDCFLSLIEQMKSNGITAPTFGHIENLIVKLFREPAGKGRSVELTTIHGAKGRESNRVWYVQRSLVQQTLSKQSLLPWQATQELNADYVALTRASDEMVFVEYSAKYAVEQLNNYSLSGEQDMQMALL